MRVALDTNVLAYAEGAGDANRQAAALATIRRIPQHKIVVPAQVLGELFNVLVRKAGRSRADARAALLSWRDAFPVVATSPEMLMAAADLATDHQLGIWHSVIMSAASRAGCRLLLSEDLQDGFTWGGLSVVNPFAERPNSLLNSILDV